MDLIVKTHVPTEAQDVGKFGQCDQSTYGTCSPHHLNNLPKSAILSILPLFYYTSFLFFPSDFLCFSQFTSNFFLPCVWCKVLD